jgi:DHA1 family inner membrane transport protein
VSATRALLIALGFLSFASVYTHVVVTPVLVEIGRDFSVTTGTAGLLIAAFGIPGIVVALFTGPLSDRRGRKPFLLWGTVVMSALTIAGALAPTFELLLVTRVLSGIGASVIFPNVTAAVGDTFHYRERGRAMSTLIAMNQVATIVGVPAAGLIAEASTWRASMALVGVLGLFSAVALWRLLPKSAPHAAETRSRDLYVQIFGDSSARAAIASSLLGSIFWFTWVTYLVAFFQTTFQLSTGIASLYALSTGLGILAGSQIGGRLGDRIGHKAIVSWTMAGAGALLFVETNFIVGLGFAVFLNFVISALGGARFATNMALLSEQAPSARGTMMAINSSIVSFGIVSGSAVGGYLIDEVGFGALGLFAMLAAVGSGLIVWRYVTERAADLAAGEASE